MKILIFEQHSQADYNDAPEHIQKIFDRHRFRPRLRIYRNGLYFFYLWRWIITNSENPRGLTEKYLQPPIKRFTIPPK